MKRSFFYLIIGLSCLSVVPSCSTFADALFLDANVVGSEKSRVLTEAGIARFRESIEIREELENLSAVKEYFDVALRFDPTNQDALEYLERIEEYKTVKLQEYRKKTYELHARKTRKTDDDYALIVMLDKASKLDPLDPELARLKVDTEDIRAKLVGSYLASANELSEKLLKSNKPKEQTESYVEAFKGYSKVLAIEPGNAEAMQKKTDLVESLKLVIDARLAEIDTRIKKSDFGTAANLIENTRDLDRAMAGAYSARIVEVEYNLHYNWALWLSGKKDLDKAEARINLALTLKKTPEALALKAKLRSSKGKVDQGAGFDTALASIDKAIQKGDVLGAQRAITSAARKATSDDQKKALAQRREKLREELIGLYQKGVAAYKEEKFSDAVAFLEKAFAIDPKYEQVGEYLEKSRAKKKLLELY